jgi:hypothetical protein
LENRDRPPAETRSESGAAPVAEAGPPPLSGTGAEFLDALALFLRTVPLYPIGHGRTEAVATRLAEVCARHGADVEIEAGPDGLRVGSGVADPKSPWARAVREALVATAVALVVFERGAPRASYETFARRLHRNARLAATGNVTFGDIWAEPIPGIRLAEQVYDRDLFLLSDDAPAPRRPLSPPGRGGSTVARDVRELVREHAEIGPLLSRLERVVESRRGDAPVAGRLDLLEHVLRLLPIEARLDPSKGLRAVEGILERFASQLLEATPDGAPPHASMLLRAVTSVFPRRPRGTAGFPLPDASAETEPEPCLTFEDLAAMEDPVLPEETVRAAAPPATPRLDSETGLRDLAGLLAHVCLVEEPGDRRDLLRRRLVEALRDGADAASSCAAAHLRDLVEEGERRDLDRVRFLAGVLEDAGLDVAAATGGWLPLDVVVAVFPRLLRAFSRGGGSAGLVCREVGRDAVLAARDALLSPTGALADPRVVERVLAERSRDGLPLLEVLLGTGDAVMRTRVAHAMRQRAIPGAAASVLRAVPEDRLSEALLRGLCEDGFRGVDSHRFEADAVTAVASVLVGPLALPDARLRAYAAAALGSFRRDLVEPVLVSLLETRFLVPLQPREVRRVARDVLDRLSASPAEGGAS